jgi:ABC-type branched-subunit amino acid transport system ATPase component
MTSQETSFQPSSLLHVEGLHVAYVKKEILCGVSLSVNRGEVVVIVGSNGAGKSTLMKALAGLLRPTRGLILLNGEDITTLSSRQRQKSGVGCLLQGGRVFSNLTVEENFAIALSEHRNGRSGNMPTLGAIFPYLRERSSTRAGLLSGGQRQMLAIEMVLAQEPELALLDEPTGAVALELSRQLLQKIAEYSKTRQAGVLLIEQNVAEAVRIGNHVLRLTEGLLEREHP